MAKEHQNNEIDSITHFLVDLKSINIVINYSILYAKQYIYLEKK